MSVFVYSCIRVFVYYHINGVFKCSIVATMTTESHPASILNICCDSDDAIASPSISCTMINSLDMAYVYLPPHAVFASPLSELIKGIYGVYMGYIWGIYGVYMGDIWGIYGVYMGYIWGIYGVYMGYV